MKHNQITQNLDGNGDLKQTIAGIYGLSTAKKMLKIEGKDLDFELFGYVSLPEVTRASRNYLSTIINGRFIKNFSPNNSKSRSFPSIFNIFLAVDNP